MNHHDDIAFASEFDSSLNVFCVCVLPQSILFDVNSTRSTFLKVSLLFDSKLMRWYSSSRESAPALG
jgi:hypothetical protein